MMRTSALEQTLRHDRLIVAIGIATVVAFSWGYLIAGAGIDMSMADMPMDPEPWSPAQALLMFAMWWVMMIAMMVPSAAPTILLFATIKRKQATADSPVISSWLFLAGYLVIWAGFSLVAVSVQWGLEQAGLLSGMMASTEQFARRDHPACRRALPTHADQARLSSLLPEPGTVPVPRTGNRTPWARCAWVFGTAATASAVAGS